jgi:hypothetical protein
MAHDDDPIRDHDLLPVPAGLPDRQEVDVHDVLADRRHEMAETLDPLDPALTLGPLDDHRHVVPALDRLAVAPVDDGLGPPAVHVDVAAVVDEIDDLAAGGARADLAEDDLAAPGAVPLHVREAAREPHRIDDGLAQRPASCQPRRVDVAMGDHLLADPLDLLPDQRARPVLRDVEVGDLAGGADRVVCELFAVDELLDTDLLDVAQPRHHAGEIRRAVDAVGVQRSGARDRFDDQRVADLFGRLLHAGHRP